MDICEEVLSPLTDSEKKLRDELCEIVDKGIKTFMKVGMALYEIKKKKLYRDTHDDWGKFCKENWDIGRNYADKQITAYKVVENLTGGEFANGYHGTQKNIVDQISSYGFPLPVNERQIRPLVTLSSKLQKIAWKESWELASEGTGRITGALVSSVVNTLTLEGKKEKVTKVRDVVVSEDRMDDETKSLLQSFLNKITFEVENNFKSTSKEALKKCLFSLLSILEAEEGANI